MRKYFKRKEEAIEYCNTLHKKAVKYALYHVYKMPKGTRHHGEFAVCEYTEFLNTY